MEQMEDESCSQDFVEVYDGSTSSEDLFFDQVVAQLQEILISPHFQNDLTSFMRNHWHIFDEGATPASLQLAFSQYQGEMKVYLQHNIAQRVPQFTWARFGQLLQNRRHMIEEQIMDTLESFDDIDSFKAFVKDYRRSFEEEQQLKVLTIKSNKISQNKIVKGKDNIFQQQGSGLLENGLKPLPKKKEAKEKTEAELLVPELVLTVKGMRKG